jgi:hypothetical protein
MTEQEWDDCDDAGRMLQFLHFGRRISDRKLRLLGCACARLVWDRAGAEPPATTIETAEAFADGLSTKAGLRRARQDVRRVRYDLEGKDSTSRPSWGAYWLAEVVATENAFGAVVDELVRLSPSCLFLGAPEWSSVCDLIRHTAGDPFDRVSIPYGSMTPTVVSLAASAYEERLSPSGELDRDRLAVLSDSLEEAGCDAGAFLDHLRGPGPHFRGCWVIDRIIGKT